MTDFSYPVIAYNTSAERAFAAITQRSDMDVYLGGTGPQSTWSPGDKVLWKSMPGAVKITLTHSGFQSEQSRMYQGISQGWVMILCSLKTFLESEMARSSDDSR